MVLYSPLAVFNVIIAEKYSFPRRPARSITFLPRLSLYEPKKKASRRGTTWPATPFHWWNVDTVS